MRAVAYRIHSLLRSRWMATIVVTLIVAVVCGGVVAFAAGARRTSTAPDRYAARYGGGFDALVTQGDGTKPRTEEIAALPGVEAADALTFVFGSLLGHDGAPMWFAAVFSGSYRPGGVHLVEGRAADPQNAHEFVATPNFVEMSHAALGDTFDLVTQTPEQSREEGFSLDDPQGPTLQVTLVGIVDGATQLDDPRVVVVVSRGLLDQFEVGVSDTLMAVDLDQRTDLAGLRAELDERRDGPSWSVQRGEVISDTVRSAVQAQARGLWLLSLVAAIAAVAVLGQVVTRQVRPARGEQTRLMAIGFTRRQVLGEAVGRAVIPIAIGSLLGVALAIAPSGAFPVGFVRVLEPQPGLRVDLGILLAGAGVFITVLTLWTVVALAVSGWAERPVRPSAVVEAVASRAASPAAGIGMRLAFTRGVRERGSVRGSVIAIVLSVAGVVAAITFGVSLERLVDQGSRYGANYDIAVGDNGAETLPDGLVDRLDANPGVKSLTLYAGTQARFGELSVPVLGVEAVRGEGTPIIVEGRLPASEDEVAFGRLTAHDLRVNVGDDVSLVGVQHTRIFRVTGIAVVPGAGSNDGIGHGGVVTMGGLRRLDDTARAVKAALQLRVSVAEFVASMPEFGDVVPDDNMPAAIVNVAHVRTIPFVLGAVLAVLAVLTVSHVMLTSMRNRRRDLAILRSLGADRRWITRAVHWQATLLTALPVVIGVPLGIVAGRLVFGTFADSMGAVRDAAVPMAIVAIGAVAIVIVANAIAVGTSRAARRFDPDWLLQGE